MAGVAGPMMMAIQAVIVRMPTPPELTGPLAPNSNLARAQPYAQGRVSAPESMIIADGYVYTGNRDGTIVEIEPNTQSVRLIHPRPEFLRACGWPRAPVGVCGRPLGLRRTTDDHLLVADPYQGILKVRPPGRRNWVQRRIFDGNARVVVSNNTMVNGRPLGYLNDVVQTRSGVIFFTSSSSKWRDPNDFMSIILEGETSGRVLVYDPSRGYPQELVTNLHFPNGVELSPNEDFLLIGEGGRSRIHRAWIGRNAPKRGTIELFADNLPGFVDNIRRTPRGTYWVGLSRARHANLPSVLDTYGTQPAIREQLLQMPREEVMANAPKYGIIIELDANGNIIRSLQDPQGQVYSGVSEVNEVNNILYLGSFEKNFIGRIDLGTLPPPTSSESGSGSGSGTGTGPGTAPQQPNAMTQLLDTVRQNIAGMDVERLRALVIQVVKKLVETVLQSRKDAQVIALLQDRQRQQQAQLFQLQQQLQQLQQLLDSRVTDSSVGANITTASTAADTTTSAAWPTVEVTTTSASPTSTASNTSGGPTTPNSTGAQVEPSTASTQPTAPGDRGTKPDSPPADQSTSWADPMASSPTPPLP